MDEQKEKYQTKDELATVQQSYDISNYEFNTTTRILYDRLLAAVMEIEPNTRVEYKKLYIAHRLRTNFMDIVVQSRRLRIAVNLDFDEVFDPKGICRDVTNLGRWGNGDVEIGFESIDQIPDTLEIIKQAIDKQK
jgi:predicted transport protein